MLARPHQIPSHGSLLFWSAGLCAVACTSHGVRRSDDPPNVAVHVPAAPVPVPSSGVPAGSAALIDAADGAAPNGSDGLSQRFVIIGDYGLSGAAEAKVAALCIDLKPDFVITTGDNNYPLGAADTIDQNIGFYFHSFIAPYRGAFGPGASENRFFPSLGNHDWYSDQARPYLDYFSLPNNERYYDVVRGPVQLFALDSYESEPDGTASDSQQANWLKERLASSTAPWKVVYFHHPPYSSGLHGSSLGMRWPFAEWGASIVYSGHDHTYERFDITGFPYIVNGVGGKELYSLGEPLQGSRVRHNDVHGLVLVTASANQFVSRFFDERGQELDVLRLVKP